MPDGEQTEPPADEDDASAESSGNGVFTAYGIASAALGALSVAAVALGAVIWSVHRSDVDERVYQTRAMQSAVEWTGVLINMNADSVDASLRQLRDGTVGELNVDFDSAVRPYREVVQRLKSRSTGRIEAVAMESVHHDLDTPPGTRPPTQDVPLPAGTRTDTVMVVATSIAENVGGKPQTVHWNLRMDVSDVDGKMRISQLESIR